MSALSLNSAYRVELNDGKGPLGVRVTFADIEAQKDYFSRLGIGALYLSPVLEFEPGQDNGYGTIDHGKVSESLGGRAGLESLSAATRPAGIRMLLDIVPNHMRASHNNPLWWDILEKGRESPHAHTLDVDWQANRGKIGDFVLEAPVGEVLNKTKHDDPNAFVLRAEDNKETGRLEIKYYDDKRRPVSAASEAKARADAAADPAAKGDVEAFLNAPENRDYFADLLAQQNYSMAFWRKGYDGGYGYRRFFDVNELVGVRQENLEVYQKTHSTVLDLVRHNIVDAIRVDHPDGVAWPGQYFDRLRADVGPDVALYPEKILEHGESLPAWPVQGTTGYDGLNELLALYVDPQSKAEFDRIYTGFTGQKATFGQTLDDGKAKVIATAFNGERKDLVKRALALSQESVETQDLTEYDFNQAVPAVLQSFNVYRTYKEDKGLRAEDREVLEGVRSAAKKRLGGANAHAGAAVDFVLDIVTGDLKDAQDYDPLDVMQFTRKLQQQTGPVMAKGKEDTAFYVYNRLTALNEVGGDPERFGTTLAEHHAVVKQRLAEYPDALVTTSTHDTKRGEDTRLRIAALSEMPRDWERHVRFWAEMNDTARGEHGPDRNDEYLLYQTMIGAWPDKLDTGDAAGLAAFAQDMKEYMRKAMREAKVHTSWVRDDEDSRNYELDVLGEDKWGRKKPGFIDQILNPDNTAFLESFRGLQQRAARVGAISSLSEVTLKFMEPGVPDLYRGGEFWDQTLVDPSNRRAVDFNARAKLLESWEQTPPELSDLRRDWTNGHIKMFVTQRLLQLRKANPDLFARGSHEPLAAATPAGGDKIVAFQRVAGDARVIVAAPRLIAAETNQASKELSLTEAFRNAVRLSVPDLAAGTVLTNVLTNEKVTVEEGGFVPLGASLGNMPVAVFRTDSVRDDNPLPPPRLS